MGTLETEVARHIAALIHGHIRPTDDGFMSFTASENGDLIHITTGDASGLNAWVLTVEWNSNGLVRRILPDDQTVTATPTIEGTLT
jgi:hypothetical protein